MRSSETSLPDFMAKSISWPIFVFSAICFLHKLPVEICTHSSSFTHNPDMVPLPEPGGPIKTIISRNEADIIFYLGCDQKTQRLHNDVQSNMTLLALLFLREPQRQRAKQSPP